MARKTILYYLGISAAVFTAAFIWFSLFDIMQVRENSMDPQLRNGQTILVNKAAYKRGNTKPDKGDIIVFPDPYNNGKMLVKRVRLLPGENLTISPDGWLQIDQERFFLTQPQRKRMEASRRIPEGHILVLGDNAFHSVDSRDYGCIPVRTIHGKVIYPKGDKKP